MNKITNEVKVNIPDHRSFKFPCDCSDWHYLQIEWDVINEEWRYLDIADVYQPGSIWNRIKVAVNILRGRTHYHTGVILNKENIEILKDLLDEFSN